jgi:hypothetical protein
MTLKKFTKILLRELLPMKFVNQWEARQRGKRRDQWYDIVNATSRNYIRRKLIFGTFKTAKDVERHLDDLGMKISYSGCLKLLRSMDFQAEI